MPEKNNNSTEKEVEVKEEKEVVSPVEAVEEKPAVVAEEETAKVEEEAPKAEEKTIEEAAPVVAQQAATRAPVQQTVVNPVPLFREGQPTENFNDFVESKRVPFYKDFSKIKMISYILMGVSLAIVVALFVCVFTIKDDKSKWVIYVLLGVCLACLIGNMIFSKLTTKKNEHKFKDYVFGFLHDLQEACYQGTALKNATVDVEGKIENEKVYNAHVFNTINRIESRSVVKGTLFGLDFVSADIALTIPASAEVLKNSRGKASEVFAVYGRSFDFDYKLEAEKGIMIIRKKSETSTIVPNHTVGFKSIVIPGLAEDITVLTNDENVAFGFFTAELIERINAFELNVNLIDYVISINDLGTYIYTNYTDDYMVVPTNKGRTQECYDQIITDTHNIIAVLELLK